MDRWELIAVLSGGAAPAGPVLVDAGPDIPLELRSGPDGLSVGPAGGAAAGDGAAVPIAALVTIPSGPSGERRLLAAVPRDPRLRINGRRPLPLKVLREGDMVSIGSRDLLLVRRYRAEVGPAPARLADKPCLLCGAPLKIATTAACPCSARFHQELAPAGPAVEKPLTCFVSAGTCPRCRRKSTLEEQLIPDPAALGF